MLYTVTYFTMSYSSACIDHKPPRTVYAQIVNRPRERVILKYVHLYIPHAIVAYVELKRLYRYAMMDATGDDTIPPETTYIPLVFRDEVLGKAARLQLLVGLHELFNSTRHIGRGKHRVLKVRTSSFSSSSSSSCCCAVWLSRRLLN